MTDPSRLHCLITRRSSALRASRIFRDRILNWDKWDSLTEKRGYFCGLWYRRQPLVCNLCSLQDYKSADCPNKGKCHRCGHLEHFAPSYTETWSPVPSVRSVSVGFPALPSLSSGDSLSIRSGAQGVSYSGGGGFTLAFSSWWSEYFRFFCWCHG